MPTLFISDLHLCSERPEISDLFLGFLTENTSIDALYILGDLFEVWIGDDAIDTQQQRLLNALKTFSDNGTPLYLMHGNRDFLIGEQFEKITGCKLLADPTVIDLYGTPTLLMHGDTLCTDDTDYMEFRAMVRNPQWQQQFLAMDIEQRKHIASKYRSESKIQTAQKKPDITDANQQAIESYMTENQVNHLIHGHTHRPAIHKFQLNNKDAQRTVLGDWYEHGSVLVVDENGYDLKTL